MDIYPLTIYHDGGCPVCRFEVVKIAARYA